MADTNNHAIRVIDLNDGNRVSTLAIAGLDAPELTDPGGQEAAAAGTRKRIERARVAPKDGAVRLVVDLKLPAGYKINPRAPMAYQVAIGSKAGDPGPLRRDGLGERVRLEKPSASFEIPLAVAAARGRTQVDVTVQYFYCREGKEALCKAGSVTWSVPLELKDDAPTDRVALEHEVR